MNRSTGSCSRLSRRERAGWAGAALVGLGLLAIAGGLRPDPRGQGTHEQLGLPPCTFRMLFNVRCPTCGMTTAWSHFAHGHVRQALMTHVSGTVLATLAAIGSLGALALAASGRRPRWWPADWLVVSAALAVAAGVLLEWGLRLTLA